MDIHPPRNCIDSYWSMAKSQHVTCICWSIDWFNEKSKPEAIAFTSQTSLGMNRWVGTSTGPPCISWENPRFPADFSPKNRAATRRWLSPRARRRSASRTRCCRNAWRNWHDRTGRPGRRAWRVVVVGPMLGGSSQEWFHHLDLRWGYMIAKLVKLINCWVY